MGKYLLKHSVLLLLPFVILCWFCEITFAGQWELVLPIYERYKVCGQIGAITIHPTNPDTMYVVIGIGVDESRFLKTTDGGQTWYDLWRGLDDNFNGRYLNLTLGFSIGDTPVLTMDPKRTNILYLFSGCGASCNKAGVFRSIDSGEHWEWWDYTPANPRGLPNKLGSVYIHPDSTNILYGDACDSLNDGECIVGGFYRSMNGGESWIRVGSYTMSPDIINPDSVNVWYSVHDDIYKSTDYGTSWIELFQVYRATPSKSLDTVETANLYVGTDGKGIYCSKDAGKTWNQCNNGISSPECLYIQGILVNPLDHNTIYAIGWGNPYCYPAPHSVFKSTNGGRSWFRMNDGLPIRADSTSVLVPETIAFSSQRNTVYIGAWGSGTCETYDGLWRYVETTNVEVDDRKKNNIWTSSTINLQQNYPNPITSYTQISFYLPDDTFIKLQIYNLQGQLIRTIINSVENRGNHIVNWDGKSEYGVSCPSGIYICKLFTSTFFQTKKIILIR